MATQYQPTVTNGVVQSYVPPELSTWVSNPSDYTFPKVSQPTYNQNRTVTLAGAYGVPDLNFNFEAEQKQAYESLKPFYDKLLSFSGGDLDRAKRVLEYTYQQGMRETKQQYEQSTKDLALAIPQEKEQLQTEQNTRGIYTSGFGQEARKRQTESQNLRKEAIDRALENRQSELTANRGFGLEEKQAGFEKDKFSLERERQKEASGMAQDVFGIKSSQFQSSLAKAAQEEQKRAQEAQNKAMEYYNPTGKSLATIYAETGRQSELDALRAKGVNI